MNQSLRQMCPQCGWSDTRPSHKTTLDELLDWVWLDPFRCRSCNARFRRFRHWWARIVTLLLIVCFLLTASGALGLLNHERKVLNQKAKSRAQVSAPTHPQQR